MSKSKQEMNLQRETNEKAEVSGKSANMAEKAVVAPSRNKKKSPRPLNVQMIKVSSVRHPSGIS